MSTRTSQQALPAKVDEASSNSDDDTLASAGGTCRPQSSYPFPDFNPPSSRPPSAYPFPEPPTTSFAQFPKPKTPTHRPKRGSKPPVSYRARSSSSLLDEFFSHPERRAVWQDIDELVRRQQVRDMDREAIGELVDFLRNHAPPPNNFMSIPDDRDAAERGRWLKLSPFANRRSKSAPKRPKPLRLPDSAVAGRTIGGHRHIAISIPVEHSPFGSNPRSQYPVYNKDGKPNTDPDPVMRFTDSNGVVTVLRTVTESGESPVSDAFTSSSRKFHRPVSVTSEPTRAPILRSQSVNDTHARDYSTASLPPTPSSRSPPRPRDSKLMNSAGDVKPGESPAAPALSKEAQASAPASSTPTRRQPMARRWSLFPAVNRGPAESIDGVMYGQRRLPANATASPPLGRAATYSGRPRSSTTSNVSNKVATTPARVRSNTAAANGSTKTLTKSNVAKVVPTIKVSSNRNSIVDWQGKVREAVAEQEAKGGGPLESPPLSAKSTDSRQSRKEKVRQRKKRDIEASRASKERRKAGSGDDTLRRSSSTPGRASLEKMGHKSDDASRMDRRPSLTPFIVVADVKPSSIPDVPAIPPTAASAPGSATFPPLHSPRGRSPRARSLQDRSLLSDRRDHRHSSFGVRSGVSPARLQPSSPGRAAYEERLREIEQRMQKLESSGGAWESIVPILDSLNRTLVMIQAERRLAGDGESKGGKKGVLTPEMPKKLTRRSTLNEQLLLDLGRVERGEMEARANDGCGLESVMRELQQGSRPCMPKEETGVAI